MPDSVVDHILEALRRSGGQYFPERAELKAVRVVGHTPKPDHYTYEIVLDFAHGSERVNAKVYRASRTGAPTRELARRELQNLAYAFVAASQQHLSGVPRPIGDFSDHGAVVSAKINGLPLQSIIMKAALLPDSGTHSLLERAARQAGEWLRSFHESTAEKPTLFDSPTLLSGLESLGRKAKKDGLSKNSAEAILAHARTVLDQLKQPVASAAVLNYFVPLQVHVSAEGIAFCDFSRLGRQGICLHDAAMFVAAVEALEKYPFCDRSITTLVQESFLDAYGVSPQEQPLLTVLKLEVLLQMFADGRAIKDSAERKKVMWANVMKRFIEQAAERSMAPAA